MTSNDKPQSAPRRSRCTTRRYRWELTLPANELFCEHGRQPSSAVRPQDVTEQRVVLAKPREIHEQLLSCRALGRRADIDDDQTRALDTLKSLRNAPMFNRPGRWSTANLRDAGQHPGADVLRQTRILADKVSDR